MQCPGLQGWAKTNQWFAVSCEYCGRFSPMADLEVQSEKVLKPVNTTSPWVTKEKHVVTETITKRVDTFNEASSLTAVDSVDELQADRTLPVPQDNDVQADADGNPVPCCLYSSRDYYYTKPIYTVAVNPSHWSPFCPSSKYGVPMIASWYVSALYNECFFLTRS
jgi:hypothetical protein